MRTKQLVIYTEWHERMTRVTFTIFEIQVVTKNLQVRISCRFHISSGETQIEINVGATPPESLLKKHVIRSYIRDRFTKPQGTSSVLC